MTHHNDEIEDHDLGLAHDLPQLVERGSMGRRGLLGLFGGLGVLAVAGCGSDGSSTPTDAASTSAASGRPSGGPPPAGGMGESNVDVADGEIPEETAGPYPGDGTNGPNVLTESGVVRSDITSSFGSASGVAEGVPTTVKLNVLDLQGTEVKALAGAAIYLWHCDRDGNYSMYSEDAADENYLRGVQVTDAEGNVEFKTIFPATYEGRWPHMHFEVYESLDAATSGSTKLRTSQLAIPAEISQDVYNNVAGYESSIETFSRVSLDTDGIFSDGYSLQLAKVTGSIDDGLTLTLKVPI